jgi:hypothetical protein
VGSYADGDDQEAERLAREVATLEADLAAWPARLEGARLAAQPAQAELGRFASERLDELLRERQEVTVRARDDLAGALEGYAAAYRQWNDVATDVRALLSLAGQPHLGAAMRSLPAALDYIATHIRQFDAAVPLPAPEPASVVSATDPAALVGAVSRRFYGEAA